MDGFGKELRGVFELQPALAPEYKKLYEPDVEMQLIAIALLYPKRWFEISFVAAEDFTQPMAAAVWTAIADTVNAGRLPETVGISQAVYAEAEDQKALRVILSQWIGATIDGSTGPEYARIIRELADRRRLMEATREIAELASNTMCGKNAAEIAGFGVSRLAEAQIANLDFTPAHEIATRMYQNLDKEIPMSKTRFPRLNSALGGGFYQNRFYGLGARMKAGKSLFMSTLAYEMTMYEGARLLYLCLEMGAEETLQRIMAMHMNQNSLNFLKPKIRTQPWFKGRMADAVAALSHTKLYFRAKPRMTLDDLKSTVARAGLSGKVDGIIVDYIQLVEGKRKEQSSAEHYDNVCQTLAEAVKRYPLWVLGAAQLNQEGNIRGSEGLLMACDMAFSLGKKEGVAGEGQTGIPDRGWLQTMVSRYTPYADVGTEEVPGYEIDVTSGPRFREL